MPDEDGYPTDEELLKVSEWQCADLDGLMQYLAGGVWHWPEFVKKLASDEWELHTGGWSGNEDIIARMQDNTMWWIMNWLQSRRGGHYLFKATIKATI